MFETTAFFQDFLYNSCSITRIFPCFSHDFPMIVQWFSNDFHMMFPWFSYDFPMIVSWFFSDFHMIFSWFSHDLPMIFHDFSAIFPCFSMIVPWVSHDFPWFSNRFWWVLQRVFAKGAARSLAFGAWRCNAATSAARGSSAWRWRPAEPAYRIWLVNNGQ